MDTNKNNTGNFIIYQTEDGLTKINVKLDSDTVWLNQQQMSELFQSSRTNIVEHIKHIYEEGELTAESTCRNFRQVRQEGSREVSREIPFYNLDMIISLGYRIKSAIATRFRISEINALEHKPMYMSDYIRQLDSVLTSGNRPLLEGSGSVSYAQALEKATAEYRKYQNNTLSPVEEAYLETMKSTAKLVKKNAKGTIR